MSALAGEVPHHPLGHLHLHRQRAGLVLGSEPERLHRAVGGAVDVGTLDVDQRDD
jgi:hypothetical protein